MKRLPNILTVIRLLLVPVFVCVYIFTNNTKIAAWIFFAAGLTDVLDGYIARKFHMESRLGALLDPLADKLLQLSVTGCLAFSYPIMGIVFAILVIKESALIIGAANLYKNKNIIISALWYGKVASLILFILIWFIIYLGDVIPNDLRVVMALVAALTALLSGVGYTINYYRNVKTKQIKS